MAATGIPSNPVQLRQQQEREELSRAWRAPTPGLQAGNRLRSCAGLHDFVPAPHSSSARRLALPPTAAVLTVTVFSVAKRAR